MNALTGVYLLLAGALAGVLLAVEIAVVPMLGALPGERFVQVHRLLDPNFDPVMPRANKLALAIGVALLIFHGDLALKISIGIAELCVIAVALVSELANVRINRRMDTWNTSALPSDWGSVRAVWFRANRARTAFAVVGFAAAVIGVVLM